MLIKNIGQNNDDENEEITTTEKVEEEEFVPVSEEDIIAQEARLAEKGKANTPVGNFINSFLNKKKEDKVVVEQFEKPKPPVDNQKVEKDMIEDLVVVAMSKGVEKAIEMAKKNKSPYIMDAFHDRLIEEMRRKGSQDN